MGMARRIIDVVDGWMQQRRRGMGVKRGEPKSGDINPVHYVRV